MNAYSTSETLDELAQKWLEKIAPYNTHPMLPHPKRSALLVTDMQIFFLDPQSPTFTCGGPPLLPRLKKLIGVFRDLGLPVIYTQHVHHPDHLDSGIMGWWWEGMCLEGSPESAIHPELSPRPGEKVVPKHRYSAFYNTDLETVLRVLKVEDLVICGVMTNMCCESSARDAYFRDYRVFFLADGTGSISEEMHLASLMSLALGFAHVTTVEQVIADLTSPPPPPPLPEAPQ
jgi:biuret amidohydrolase